MGDVSFDTESMGAGDPGAALALDSGGSSLPKEKPRISTPEEAARLSPGTSFIGPDDKEHVVPYKVSHPQQVADIPDGAEFVGPDGKVRQKPKYEGIDFTAPTLSDMSVNDQERKRALDRSYKGKVRDDPSGGFYVEDDDGVMRKPGRGVSKVTGAVASAAAPTILSVLGALGGGAVGGTGGAVAGSAVPVVGTIAGGIGGGTAGAAVGGAGGAMLGQTFNDLIMGLAGTYDRSSGGKGGELAISGPGGMMGAGVGRGVSTVVPSIKSGISAMTAAAPGAARSFLGAGEAELKQASSLAEKGVAVPPSAWAKEAPHLQNVVEVFDPAFHTNQPLLESATAHYEKSAGEILQTLGIKNPGSLTKPISDIPTKEAGEAVMRRTLGELAEKDSQMQAALDAKKAAINPESVKGAAVKIGDEIYEAPNHFTALKQAAEKRGVSLDDVLVMSNEGKAVDGFVTSNGRFIERAEADKIASSLGQKRALNSNERKASGGLGANELQPPVTKAAEAMAQRETVLKAAEEARTAAQRVIDAGYKDIESDISTAMKVADAGINSGDLWGAVGQKLVATRQAIGARASKMYDAADHAAGGHLPNIEGLPHQAQQFLDQLPPDFQSKYPDMVRKLRDLAGTKDEKTGEWIKEPFNPTFGQLHDIRSQFRSNINYSDLTPDIRDGSYKFFAGKVDQILHDVDAVPELREASKLLKDADAFYRDKDRKSVV